MKLSEAILRGCEMTPKQAFWKAGKRGEATCVIEAAREGGRVPFYRSVLEAFHLSGDVVNEAIRLNDTKRWSRERIAGWLAEKGL